MSQKTMNPEIYEPYFSVESETVVSDVNRLLRIFFWPASDNSIFIGWTSTQGQNLLGLRNEWRKSLKDRAKEVFQECRAAGWDGEDAKPIRQESYEAVLRLIEQLPESVMQPEITPEPSGNLALEWRVGDSKLLSVSMAGEKLIYACVIKPGSKDHGEKSFYHELPETIQTILQRHFLRSLRASL